MQASGGSATVQLRVACLCAAWCRLCDDYASVFDTVTRQAGAPARWIDIEDEAALVGDYDVETFPTLVVADTRHVYFAGPLEPHAQTLERVLRRAAEAADDGTAPAPPLPDVHAFVTRWRREWDGGTAGPRGGETT